MNPKLMVHVFLIKILTIIDHVPPSIKNPVLPSLKHGDFKTILHYLLYNMGIKRPQFPTMYMVRC